MQKRDAQCILSLKSFDSFQIKSSVNHIRKTLNSWGIPLKYCFFVGKPTRHKKYTLLRSPHVHKKSREQFEWISRKGELILCFYTLPHLVFLLFWLQHSQFPGVQIMVTIRLYTNMPKKVFLL